MSSIVEKRFIEIEYGILQSDGSIVWILDHMNLIFGGEDNPMGLDDITTDSIVRKRTEKALKEREGPFRSLVDNVPGVIFQCHRHLARTMLFISYRVEGICGYLFSSFMEDTMISYGSLIHDEDSGQIQRTILGYIEKRIRYHIHYHFYTKKTQLKWIYEKRQTIDDDEGRLLYIDGVIMDTTKSKEIEEERKTITEEYQKVFHGI